LVGSAGSVAVLAGAADSPGRSLSQAAHLVASALLKIMHTGHSQEAPPTFGFDKPAAAKSKAMIGAYVFFGADVAGATEATAATADGAAFETSLELKENIGSLSAEVERDLLLVEVGVVCTWNAKVGKLDFGVVSLAAGVEDDSGFFPL